MTIVGAFLLIFAAAILSDFPVDDARLALLGILITVSAIFVITGGVFCLERNYWRICLASASLLFVLSALALSFFAVLWSYPYPEVPGALVYYPPIWPLLMVAGIPPLIFVCLRKSEWSESQT